MTGKSFLSDCPALDGEQPKDQVGLEMSDFDCQVPAATGAPQHGAEPLERPVSNFMYIMRWRTSQMPCRQKYRKTYREFC